ncbi:MAG: hypothetical protein ABJV04_09400 [Aliiglaciecola sp.]|uniref:hypothetical protein n=1 Tax=Aliiglaciecola sp. TaxID=1872441 RepID=UPI003299700A
MDFKLIIIALVVSVGFFVTSTGLAGGSPIYTFLASFGLFMIILVISMLLFAKKKSKK